LNVSVCVASRSLSKPATDDNNKSCRHGASQAIRAAAFPVTFVFYLKRKKKEKKKKEREREKNNICLFGNGFRPSEAAYSLSRHAEES